MQESHQVAVYFTAVYYCNDPFDVALIAEFAPPFLYGSDRPVQLQRELPVRQRCIALQDAQQFDVYGIQIIQHVQLL